MPLRELQLRDHRDDLRNVLPWRSDLKELSFAAPIRDAAALLAASPVLALHP